MCVSFNCLSDERPRTPDSVPLFCSQVIQAQLRAQGHHVRSGTCLEFLDRFLSSLAVLLRVTGTRCEPWSFKRHGIPAFFLDLLGGAPCNAYIAAIAVALFIRHHQTGLKTNADAASTMCILAYNTGSTMACLTTFLACPLAAVQYPRTRGPQLRHGARHPGVSTERIRLSPLRLPAPMGNANRWPDL